MSNDHVIRLAKKNELLYWNKMGKLRERPLLWTSSRKTYINQWHLSNTDLDGWFVVEFPDVK
jgi:hypothetical protein